MLNQVKTTTQPSIIDFFEWDVANWSRALKLWNQEVENIPGPLLCLDLGSRQGGLSLWLAFHGHDVICSDLTNPEEQAGRLIGKFHLNGRVSYAAIDATEIPYENHFDVIIFKSILGGIGYNGRNDLQEKTIASIYKALKPGGKLLFAENLSGSLIHKFARKYLVRWGASWNYPDYERLYTMLSPFREIKLDTAGFAGVFGRSGRMNRITSSIDKWIFNKNAFRSIHYICFGVAKK